MKKILFILCILSYGIWGYAQVVVKSTSQSLIEQALQNSIFEVEQRYQLLDTVSLNKYGRNGKDYFGSSLSLCIKVKNGYYAPKQLFFPWINDVNFDKYKGKYAPLRTEPIIRSYHTDSSFIGMTIIDSLLTHLEGVPYVYVRDTSFADNSGLTVSIPEGDIDGWIFSVSDDAINPFSIFKEEVQVDSTFSSWKINSYLHTSTKGGIFVIATQGEIGSVCFKLCGILSKKDDDWYIDFPFRDDCFRDELSIISDTLESKKVDTKEESSDKKDDIKVEKKKKHKK